MARLLLREILIHGMSRGVFHVCRPHPKVLSRSGTLNLAPLLPFWGLRGWGMRGKWGSPLETGVGCPKTPQVRRWE